MKHPPPGKRISIRGTSGSGKSTMGKALAATLGFPSTELDSIYHLPNWQELDVPEFRRQVSELAAQDAWVIDGNYSKVYDLVLARADTVIWLDYPLHVVLRRLMKRILRRGLLREELWNGNRESIWRHLFTRESLILWVLQTHPRRKNEAQAFCTDPELAHLTRIRFTNPREADLWLREVAATASGTMPPCSPTSSSEESSDRPHRFPD